MLGLAEVAEILVHRRLLFAQRMGQALAEIVVRCDAVGNGLGLALEQVAGYVADHGVPLARWPMWVWAQSARRCRGDP
jgi:hypothetical protein